jgi:hypothetical protein
VKIGGIEDTCELKPDFAGDCRVLGKFFPRDMDIATLGVLLCTACFCQYGARGSMGILTGDKNRLTTKYTERGVDTGDDIETRNGYPGGRTAGELSPLSADRRRV